jgi:hypothetical protein
MTLKDYVKQFAITEREKLANEIHVSVGYLNKLVVDSHPPASAKLAKLIFFSKFNESLPVKMRFTAKDSVQHVQLKVAERAKNPKKYNMKRVRDEI